jgi:hypothetical protein
VTTSASPRAATARGRRESLAPGKTFEDTVNLAKWFEFKEAGAYEIHGSYRLNIQVSGNLTKPYVQWTDYAETDFVVTVE